MANLDHPARHQLHRTELQRFDFFLVLVEMAVRVRLALTRPLLRSSASCLKRSEPLPFGESGATTWLNLMTTGAVVWASAKGATAARPSRRRSAEKRAGG